MFCFPSPSAPLASFHVGIILLSYTISEYTTYRNFFWPTMTYNGFYGPTCLPRATYTSLSCVRCTLGRLDLNLIAYACVGEARNIAIIVLKTPRSREERARWKRLGLRVFHVLNSDRTRDYTINIVLWRYTRIRLACIGFKTDMFYRSTFAQHITRNWIFLFYFTTFYSCVTRRYYILTLVHLLFHILRTEMHKSKTWLSRLLRCTLRCNDFFFLLFR